jgi:hypothetical protein
VDGKLYQELKQLEMVFTSAASAADVLLNKTAILRILSF